MSKLTTKDRNAMPAAKFAGPNRSYPINDVNHARNALARSSQMVNAGKLTPSTAATIKAKANKVIGKESALSTSMRGRGKC